MREESVSKICDKCINIPELTALYNHYHIEPLTNTDYVSTEPLLDELLNGKYIDRSLLHLLLNSKSLILGVPVSNPTSVG